MTIACWPSRSPVHWTAFPSSSSRHARQPQRAQASGQRAVPARIRLISYDRPGYGGSSRYRGRSVADAAADVDRIADALGLDAFAVVGRSGGGPHALACAALLNGRVTRTAGLVSVAHPDADELDWFDQMTERTWPNIPPPTMIRTR